MASASICATGSKCSTFPANFSTIGTPVVARNETNFETGGSSARPTLMPSVSREDFSLANCAEAVCCWAATAAP